MKRTQAERQAFCDGAAARMTANPTTAEARLWEVLEPLGFSRQVMLGGKTKNGGEWSYIADFYYGWPLKLVVEVARGRRHQDNQGDKQASDERIGLGGGAGEGIYAGFGIGGGV